MRRDASCGMWRNKSSISGGVLPLDRSNGEPAEDEEAGESVEEEEEEEEEKEEEEEEEEGEEEAAAGGDTSPDETVEEEEPGNALLANCDACSVSASMSR